jgi:hypothetical protein
MEDITFKIRHYDKTHASCEQSDEQSGWTRTRIESFCVQSMRRPPSTNSSDTSYTLAVFTHFQVTTQKMSCKKVAEQKKGMLLQNKIARRNFFPRGV